MGGPARIIQVHQSVGRNEQTPLPPELRSLFPSHVVDGGAMPCECVCAVPANTLRVLVPAYMNNPGSAFSVPSIRCGTRLRGQSELCVRVATGALTWRPSLRHQSCLPGNNRPIPVQWRQNDLDVRTPAFPCAVRRPALLGRSPILFPRKPWRSPRGLVDGQPELYVLRAGSSRSTDLTLDLCAKRLCDKLKQRQRRMGCPALSSRAAVCPSSESLTLFRPAAFPRRRFGRRRPSRRRRGGRRCRRRTGLRSACGSRSSRVPDAC